MIKNQRNRRILSLTLLVLGGLLMFLAPEEAKFGAVLLALGILVEIVGISLAHRNGK